MPTTVSSAAAKAPTLARRFTTRTKRTGVRTYTTTGTVLLPSGTRAAACNGKVQVMIKAGKRTLSTQQVVLGAKCAFSSRVTISAAKLRRASRVTVQVRFLGNAASSPSRRRAGASRSARRVAVTVAPGSFPRRGGDRREPQLRRESA